MSHEMVRGVGRTDSRIHSLALIAGFAMGCAFVYPVINSPELVAGLIMFGLFGSFVTAAIPTRHWIRIFCLTLMLTVGAGPVLFYSYLFLFQLLGIF